MKEYRCNNCNKQLFKGELGKGHLEIKCPRCNTLNKLGEEIKITNKLRLLYDKVTEVNCLDGTIVHICTTDDRLVVYQNSEEYMDINIYKSLEIAIPREIAGKRYAVGNDCLPGVLLRNNIEYINDYRHDSMSSVMIFLICNPPKYADMGGLTAYRCITDTQEEQTSDEKPIYPVDDIILRHPNKQIVQMN